MPVTTKIQKWGNSFAVRIPQKMIQSLALKEGSGIVICEDEKVIMIRRHAPTDRPASKNDWKKYLIPISHKKENVSGTIDHILYGAPR